MSTAALLALTGCTDVVWHSDDAELSGAVAVDLPVGDDLLGVPTLRHFGLDALLRLQTVDTTGATGAWRLVDYAGLVASPEATGALASYLAGLASVDPSQLATPDERLAYWLNAYNAWVLYAVAAKYAEDPTYNVESDGWLIFTTPFIEVAGVSLTPNDLEHGILRADPNQVYADAAAADRAGTWHDEVWGGAPPDARLHMGLNCASWSCPNVTPGAFQGDRVWDQLDALSVAFLDNPEKGAGADGVSTLFNWFAGDFEGTFGSAADFVATYRTGGLDGVDMATFLAYDWSLNEASAAAVGAPTCAPW